jgi:hypothetical protein
MHNLIYWHMYRYKHELRSSIASFAILTILQPYRNSSEMLIEKFMCYYHIASEKHLSRIENTIVEGNIKCRTIKIQSSNGFVPVRLLL